MQGVKVDTIKEGRGDYPKPGQTVCVHYTGTLTDGTKFDSSRDKGRPFRFKLGAGKVIRAYRATLMIDPTGNSWDEGVAKMKIGERANLTCSPEYGYGSQGYPGVIPPNATLLFDVELISVE